MQNYQQQLGQVWGDVEIDHQASHQTGKSGTTWKYKVSEIRGTFVSSNGQGTYF